MFAPRATRRIETHLSVVPCRAITPHHRSGAIGGEQSAPRQNALRHDTTRKYVPNHIKCMKPICSWRATTLSVEINTSLHFIKQLIEKLCPLALRGRFYGFIICSYCFRGVCKQISSKFFFYFREQIKIAWCEVKAVRRIPFPGERRVEISPARCGQRREVVSTMKHVVFEVARTRISCGPLTPSRALLAPVSGTPIGGANPIAPAGGQLRRAV
ncbi:hypothetical protein EVAR_102137_1 [Eumeta japonica]|uniref:Uncharacterized protein n=1 Tax=Eumeta variegata TaxID=151549 RepID=A0A4C1TZX0_EUMVA|nr:hypothetical protein EVAR_102137_1 [Eumeta japonica]